MFSLVSTILTFALSALFNVTGRSFAGISSVTGPEGMSTEWPFSFGTPNSRTSPGPDGTVTGAFRALSLSADGSRRSGGERASAGG